MQDAQRPISQYPITNRNRDPQKDSNAGELLEQDS
jgi:hypothetical protein